MAKGERRRSPEFSSPNLLPNVNAPFGILAKSMQNAGERYEAWEVPPPRDKQQNRLMRKCGFLVTWDHSSTVDEGNDAAITGTRPD